MWSFFFCQGFPSRTLTVHKTGGEGRRLSFISLYRPRTFRHFFPTSHVRWYHTFLIAPLVFTWCYMRFTTLSNYHLTDLGRDVILCLFIWWFDSRFLLQQFDAGNQWIWTSIDNHPLYYKQTDWPSVLVTPRKDLYRSFQNAFSFSCILRGLLV